MQPACPNLLERFMTVLVYIGYIDTVELFTIILYILESLRPGKVNS